LVEFPVDRSLGLNRRRISGVRIVRTVIAISAAILPIGVIDAIRGIFAAVASVRIADRVGVILIRAEIAQVFARLTINQMGRFGLGEARHQEDEKGGGDEFHGGLLFLVRSLFDHHLEELFSYRQPGRTAILVGYRLALLGLVFLVFPMISNISSQES
jgi:hypothetical protein